MYFRKKTSGGRAYLQIVHARRDGTRIRQQVIATLGRLDELVGSGQLERLLRSGARFAAKAMVLVAMQEGAASEVEVRRLGPGLVFERLWMGAAVQRREPEGLATGKASGNRPILGERERAALRQAVEEGPTPAIHGVVRWRIVDLTQWLWEKFWLSVSKQTMRNLVRGRSPDRAAEQDHPPLGASWHAAHSPHANSGPARLSSALDGQLQRLRSSMVFAIKSRPGHVARVPCRK
jgi:hypothetical protein